MAMHYHIRTIIHTKNNCTRLVYIVAVATEKLSEYSRPSGRILTYNVYLVRGKFYGRKQYMSLL